MSDAQELPETDDPLAFFDVEADTDERTLKRAYTRLIRRFRPEQRPVEFQRIRAMYDQAQEWLALRDADEFDDGEWEDPEWPEDAADPPELAAGITKAWERVAAGAPAEALAALAEQTTIAPHDAAPRVHAFLVREVLGESFQEAVPALLEGLAVQGASAEVARWVATTFDRQEREHIAQFDSIRWDLLGDRDATPWQAQLFRQRVHNLLRRGEAAAAFDLLAQPDVRDAAFHGAAVRLVTLEAVCYGLWSAEPRAMELYEELVAEVDPTQPEAHEDPALETCLHVEWATRSWRETHVARSAPSALVQFLATCAIFEDEAAEETVRELRRQLSAAPDAYLRAITQMTELAPQAHVYLRGLIGVPLPEEGEDDDEDEDDTTPLTVAQEAAVAEFARAVDPDLHGSVICNIEYAVVLLILVGVVAAFFVIGWWGLLTLLAGIVLWAVVWIKLDRMLFAQFVRAPLARTIAQVGVRPRQVTTWLDAHEKEFQKVDCLGSEIRGDTSLATLAELSRYSHEVGTQTRL